MHPHDASYDEFSPYRNPDMSLSLSVSLNEDVLEQAPAAAGVGDRSFVPGFPWGMFIAVGADALVDGLLIGISSAGAGTVVQFSI